MAEKAVRLMFMCGLYGKSLEKQESTLKQYAESVIKSGAIPVDPAYFPLHTVGVCFDFDSGRIVPFGDTKQCYKTIFFQLFNYLISPPKMPYLFS